MYTIKSSLFLVLCVAATTSAVTKIQTISIHSPTSGAVLNPVGAAMNTKLQAKVYNSPYAYGHYSPYGGIGMGAGLAGYGGVVSPLAIDGYGATLGGYGGVPGYQYGYPGLPGSYSVKTIYPPGKAAYDGQAGVYPAGYSIAGAYSNIGSYPYASAGSYPGYGNAGVYGSQYGVNQGYNKGYLSYDAVNKLSGYGQ